MSPRYPVPTLYLSSMHVIINNIVASISLIHIEGNLDEWDTYEAYEEELQSLSEYLSCLPPNISQELMQSILSTDDLDAAIRFCALKLLFHNHIRSLIVGPFPPDYYMKVLDVVAEHGADLHILDLRGVWVKGDESQKLQEVLQKLPNLKELYMPHVANDAVLGILGRHHSSLLVLDISGACEYSREGIDMLTRGSSSLQPSRLQIVNIGTPGEGDVNPANVAILLKNLPDLISLGAYSFVGRALLHLIAEDDVLSTRTTKLQQMHDTETDPSILDAIVKLCPNLESIYLDRPNEGVIGRLHLIPKLNQVKLNRFDCAELDPLLSRCGGKFEAMELLVGKGVLDMSSIANNCPLLKKLVCYKMEFLTHYEQVFFPNLTKLEILHSPISTSCVRYLMTCCPQLEELSVGESIDLTDNDVADILSKSALGELRELWVASARNLSRISVEVLMITCPKLKSIGVLSGWGLTPDDVQELLYEIQISNMDLMLWEFFSD